MLQRERIISKLNARCAYEISSSFHAVLLLILKPFLAIGFIFK